MSAAEGGYGYMLGPSLFNRQLAKLLSGNEVRGKVAIAAVQMTVNFTRSLSRWPRKVFEHSFLRIWEGSNAQDLFAELLRAQDAFFSGKKADFFYRNDGAWPARGKP